MLARGVRAEVLSSTQAITTISPSPSLPHPEKKKWAKESYFFF